MNEYIEFSKRLETTRLNHKIWQEVLNEAFARIAMASAGEIVIIIGPPRVGKTKLSLCIRQLLNSKGVQIDDANSISIGLRASNCSTNGMFSTKAFAQRALWALGNPLFQNDSKIPHMTEAATWLAVERGLKKSCKRYMFIDETNNITRTKGQSPGAILDAWKCIAEETGIVLVLSGTYQLNQAVLQAPHVIGRKSVVHFKRYKISGEDIGGFHDILSTYNEILPIASEVGDLRNYSEQLYSGSLGCIGLLQRWLKESLAVASVKKKPIGLDELSLTRICDRDLNITLEEIVTGEKWYESKFEFKRNTAPSKVDPSKNEVLEDKNSQSSPASVESNLDDSTENQDSQKKSKSKPWVCKPKRYKTTDRLKEDEDV